jgi:hypothetical protein
MTALGMDSFDQWLGEQLNQHASGHGGPSPMPSQAAYHAAHVRGTVHMPLLAKLAAALSTKAAIGVAAGALVVGAAGSEAVITGSINPGDWGKQVVQQVNSCKEALAPGSHGIGDCVSSFAAQQGKKSSSDHKVTPTNYGNGNGKGPDHTPGTPSNKVHPSPPNRPHPTRPSIRSRSK